MFYLQVDERGLYTADVATVIERFHYKAWQDEQPIDTYFRLVTAYELAALSPDSSAIPVGSVQFINVALAKLGCSPIRAINIPPALQAPGFLLRDIWPSVDADKLLDTNSELWAGSERLFYKPADYCKAFESDMVSRANVAESVKLNKVKGPIFVSQEFPSPIVAEWRIFVREGRMIAAHPYYLDTWVFPDQRQVEAMVGLYAADARGEAPPAFTLDVAVLQDGRTALVEVHTFLACGLYGFESSAIIPMLTAAYRWEIKNSRLAA